MNRIAILLLLALPVAAAWADDRETALRDKAYTIFSGDFENAYHGNEAPLNPGKGWYALFQEGSRSRLVAAKLTGRRAQDIVLDDDKGPFTGVKITASPPKALAYLRHPSLRVGEMPSVILRKSGEEALRLDIQSYQNAPERQRQRPLLPFHDLEFREHAYQLNVRMHMSATEPNTYKSFSLLLSLDGGSPITLSTDGWPDEGDDGQQILLLWAGDLNQDGFLDFIVEKTYYNNGATCWYLSRKSQPLSYEAVGCHKTSGC
jgi:hypothetical protein